MSRITKKELQELSALYGSCEINEVWQGYQDLEVINHPTLGKISPYQYRVHYHLKPCPFCGQKMVQGKFYTTKSKKAAIEKGYQYQDTQGNDVINRAGETYFHTHYVTLDHKLNKARFPERMLDADNLQIMCWKCNIEKGDNNAYELEHSFDYINDLAKDALQRYPLL